MAPVRDVAPVQYAAPGGEYDRTQGVNMVEINVWAIVVATVASQIAGYLWYSVLFGRAWAGAYRLEADALSSTPAAAYGITLLGALVFSGGVATFAGFLGVAGLAGGVVLGGGLWAGIVLPRYLLHALFARVKPTGIAIDLGFDLIAAVLTGLVIGAWPAT